MVLHVRELLSVLGHGAHGRGRGRIRGRRVHVGLGGFVGGAGQEFGVSGGRFHKLGGRSPAEQIITLNINLLPIICTYLYTHVLYYACVHLDTRTILCMRSLEAHKHIQVVLHNK